MRCPLFPRRALLACLVVLNCGTSLAEGAPVYEALWYSKGTPEPARKVELNVQAERDAPADKTYTWVCNIDTKLEYRNALVTMTVTDANDKPVLSGEQEMALPQGPTRCSFDLDPMKLAPGHYTATFTCQFTEKEEPATFTAQIRRVSAGDLQSQLDKASATLASLDEQASGTKPSYTTLRVRIAKDFAGQVAQDVAAGKWHTVAEKVDYAVKVAGGAGADIALSGVMPEAVEAAADPAMSDIHVENGAFATGGAPVFLVGGPVFSADDAAKLRRYGLNYGVVTVRPADALDAGADKDLSAAYGPVFAALANANLASTVHLDAGALTGWPRERMPDADNEGFVNLAREDVQALISRHLKAALPFITQQRGISGVSLLDTPQFKFTGESVHRQFIDKIEALYPDRQALNAQWSAHLAAYDDITMWGRFIDGRPDPKIPDYHYEKKRAYTFDFTAYHLGLMENYLKDLADQAHALAPNLPFSVTMPDTDFDKNQTSYTPDREQVARMFGYTSCALTAGALDPVYGIAYPHTDAVLTLLHSLDESKPVTVDKLHAPIDETMDPAALFDFVQTLVWNSVIDGADAIALSAASEVYSHPAALEGFAAAGMDINRLAPIVSALQKAPSDVSILYSDSSKILDGGDPHLKSCSFAYEGCSFSGLTVRYITERQCVEGKLNDTKIIVLPETPALRGETFKKLEAFVDGGGIAARVGSPIPYDEHGRSRTSVLRNTGRTLIVRGFNLPTEYLHAMDSVNERAKLPPWPRPINGFQYPLEGVKSRFVEVDGVPYLYLVNLRKEAVNCYLYGGMQSGRDLVRGHDIAFPTYLDPLHPMLIRLDANVHRTEVTSAEPEKKRKKH